MQLAFDEFYRLLLVADFPALLAVCMLPRGFAQRVHCIFSTLDTECIFQLLLDHNVYLWLAVICQLDARAFFSILNEDQFRNYNIYSIPPVLELIYSFLFC